MKSLPEIPFDYKAGLIREIEAVESNIQELIRRRDQLMRYLAELPEAKKGFKE